MTTPIVPGAMRQDWAGLGACVSGDPDDLFVKGAAQQQAKVVCQRCPVIAECLADALDHRTEFGVWGGMTERERPAQPAGDLVVGAVFPSGRGARRRRRRGELTRSG